MFELSFVHLPNVFKNHRKNREKDRCELQLLPSLRELPDWEQGKAPFYCEHGIAPGYRNKGR